MYRKYTQPPFRPDRAGMLELIHRHVAPVKGIERVPFARSLGRVCGEDIHARHTLPNTAVSRLDGIGVRFDDFIHGIPDTSGWQEDNQFYFANTGMALRDGFDTEILIEEVDFENGRLTVHSPPRKRGDYIAPAGGFMKAGELLIPRGTSITPPHLSLLAAGGVAEVPVQRRPAVVILPTGNELVPPGQPVEPGQNVESNGVMLAGFLESWGCNAVLEPVVPDHPERLYQALSAALEASDAVVVIAGSSLGTGDYTAEVVARLAHILAPELSHGPGRKSSLAIAGNRPVVGVAGPPIGAQITAELYLRPVADRLAGRPIHRYETLEVVTNQTFPAYEVDFVERLHVSGHRGDFRCESTMVRGATRAEQVCRTNAFLYHEAGKAYEAGDSMVVELLVPQEQIPSADDRKGNCNPE